MMEAKDSVRRWIDNLTPEHLEIAVRVDALIKAVFPDIVSQTKWHKPTQPLGVPFYGLPGKGWMFAMWSFKTGLGVGFIAGTLLDPEPPVDKMAGPWNKSVDCKARRIDIKSVDGLDEVQMRSWFEQARNLPGWGKVDRIA